MWSIAVTAGAAELTVRDRLAVAGLQVFCPYERIKARTKVRAARTRATPNPRDRFTVALVDVARWPRYIFARAPHDEDLDVILHTRGVHGLIKGSDDLPSLLPDRLVDALRKDCAPDGLIVKRSVLLQLSVGDVLRFVAPSPFADKLGEVESLERLDDSGDIKVLVDVLGRKTSTEVHYSEVERVISAP